MLRVPHRRIVGRAGYGLRLISHAAAWRGEVNRSRCAWASSGRANHSAISACRAACVLATQPTGRVVGRPPAPRRGAGGVRPVGTTGQPEPGRPGQDAPLHDPARIVQGDNGVGVRGTPPSRRCTARGQTPIGSRRRPLRLRPGWRSRGIRRRQARRVRHAARLAARRAPGPVWSCRCRRSRSPRPAQGPVGWVPDALPSPQK
jgi:hypothetical protein